MTMEYSEEIASAVEDPRRLEELYQGASRNREEELFRAALETSYQQAPSNVLLSAWHYRLASGAARERPAAGIHAKLAIPLSLAAGLLLWLLSDSARVFPDGKPVFLALWAPLEALFVLAYLWGSSRRQSAGVPQAEQKELTSYLPALLGLTALTAVAVAWIGRPVHEQVPLLMFLHLPLAAWSAVGLSLAGLRSGHRDRFAFLFKSLEVFATGAIFCGAVGLFAAITLGLFAALEIELSPAAIRLLLAGGLGAVPVWAVAVAYDPRLGLLKQPDDRGLGRLIPMMMWVLLPLSLVVGAAYLTAIPFNFMGPFRSRDLLIVYNGLLFAVQAMQALFR